MQQTQNNYTSDTKNISESFTVELIGDNIIENVVTLKYNDATFSTLQTKLMLKNIEKLMSQHPEIKFSILSTRSDKSTTNFMSNEARSLVLEFLENHQIKYVAVCGYDRIVSVVAKLIAKFAGFEGKLKIFTHRKDALDWLKNNSN